jgi:hypothetical protein
MTQNRAPNSIFEEFPLVSPLAGEATEATRVFSLDRVLRTLGTMLQQDGFSEFELLVCDEVYVVRGQATAGQFARRSLFRKIFSLRRWRDGNRPTSGELRYSITDLLSFESNLGERRKQSREMPDPYSPSQILRGVGSYLDNRDGSRLVSVKVKDRWVTIEHIARDGKLEKSHQDFKYFYNYSLKSYLRRSNRSKLAPPSDPPFFVKWESR